MSVKMGDKRKVPIALAIIEVSRNKFLLQLRDNKTSIVDPDSWALFGGRVEEMETPLQAIQREIFEELSVEMASSRLSYLDSFELDSRWVHFLFHYLCMNEVENMVLQEGQAFGSFGKEEILTGTIYNKTIAPIHLTMLKLYFGYQGDVDNIPHF